jgi:hypothetical protein
VHAARGFDWHWHTSAAGRFCRRASGQRACRQIPLFDQLVNLSHRADDVYPEAAGRRTEIEVVPE